MNHVVLNKSFRAAVFNQDVIILSIEKNRYYLMPCVSLEAIADLKQGYFSRKSDPDLFESLQEIGAISYGGNKMDPIIDRTDVAFFDPRWIPPAISEGRKHTFLNKIESILCVAASSLVVRFGSFQSILILIRILRYIYNEKSKNNTAIEEKILSSILGINKFFWLDFSNNRCLTYCCAQILLLRKYARSLKIVIGVRTRPFCSHAWIEYEGLPIAEGIDIRRKLSPVLEF